MIKFLQTPLGSAVAGAIAIVVGLFFFGSIGWIDEPDVWVYVLGAVAGFVGGWIGGNAMSRSRRNE